MNSRVCSSCTFGQTSTPSSWPRDYAQPWTKWPTPSLEQKPSGGGRVAVKQPICRSVMSDGGSYDESCSYDHRLAVERLVLRIVRRAGRCGIDEGNEWRKGHPTTRFDGQRT